MLTISKSQMTALDESSIREFHRRLCRFLREEIPEATTALDDRALTRRIRQGEERAASYGIDSEAGIAQFVCLTFAAGPQFDEMPEVREFLQLPDLSAEEKLDELVSYLNALEDDPGTTPENILLSPEE